jgi:hypothetical protein
MTIRRNFDFAGDLAIRRTVHRMTLAKRKKGLVPFFS